MMRNKTIKVTISLIFVLALIFPSVLCAQASNIERYQNPETGYKVIIIDEDDLLTGAEERLLVQDMIPLTAYGNIAFWTTSEYTSNEIDQARMQRRALFNFESAGIFVINMNVRKLTIQSYGDMYNSITDSYARSITNNVSSYATTGEYYQSAKKAYSQMLDVCERRHISEPLKVSGYVVISLMLGLIIAIAAAFSKRNNPIIQFNEPDNKNRFSSTGGFTGAVVPQYAGQKTVHREPSSSSSGSSCSSCSSCSSGSSCGGCGGGGSSSF